MSQTTGGGIQVPTISDDPDVPRDALRIVTDVEPSLVYQHQTTTERDAVFSLVGHKLCFVGDQLQQRIGSNWVKLLAGPSWLEAKITNDVAIPSGGWKIAPTNASAPTHVEGTDIVGDVNSPTIMTPGLYNVYASVLWKNSGAGRRGVGFTTSTTVNDPDVYTQQTEYVSTGLYTSTFSTQIYYPAPGRLCLTCYQDSGSSLTVSNRRIVVSRIA